MDRDPQPARVSMRDIGKILGVSHVTVSLALRNSSRVAPETRQRVLEVAQKMGYRPDPILAGLANYRQSKSNPQVQAAIAWVNAWPQPEKLRMHHEFDLYLKGASAAAHKFGYRLEEFRMNTEYSPQRLNQVLQARGIRGILLPPQYPPPDWLGFPWENYSVVRFGRSLETPRSHLVTSDHVVNTLLAFQKIQELGYRRIGFLTNDLKSRDMGHYFEGGYLMAQRRVPNKDRIPIFSTSGPPGSSISPALAQWVRKYRVEAIFTNIAEASQALEKAGIKVPDDVALAATTLLDTDIDAGIDQEPEEIGRVGFLMLNSLINDGARGIPRVFRQNLVEGSWVDGKCMPRRDAPREKKS